jgi:HD-GYP domain-containing protein (c-di-GMP phosphodiesterase class II)
MLKYNIKDISVGTVFQDVVYLDTQFVLIPPETPVTEQWLRILNDWDIKEIFCDVVTLAQKTDAELDTILAQDVSNDEDKIERAKQFYETFREHIKEVYILAADKNKLDYEGLVQLVAPALSVIKQDKRFLLRVQKTPPTENENSYLASHAVRSMIISIIIGLYLKLSDEKLIELGVAALLHEIGMTKIPNESKGYFVKRPLTQGEKKAIFSHPVLSYKVLKSFNAPLVVCLAGLEHHERENGSGYPQKLTGDRISLYAKIIGVACSYDALIANRPHQDAKDGYTGMLDLLKNEGKQYDETIVKALLYSLSMYPIGLYVLLSNGKKGQVIDINPEKPLFPIVQVFGEFTPQGDNLVVQTAKNTIRIIRPLKKEEIGN